MNKLKPCPFCGGELEEFKHSYFINHKNGCFLGTKRYLIRSICKFNSRGKKSTYDIRKWNTRAERTCTLTGNAFKAFNDTTWRHCSECDADIMEGKHNYCWKCGAKVVES